MSLMINFSAKQALAGLYWDFEFLIHFFHLFLALFDLVLALREYFSDCFELVLVCYFRIRNAT